MNNMVLMEVVAEQSFWAKHLFDILTIGIGLAFTIALYIWASSKNSHQLRMYIPTIWTSLGILFTFISIYKGLTDKELLTDVSKGQIENLIGRIIPAFSTSIIGIIGAIICSIINKGLLAGIEDKGTKAFNGLKQQMDLGNEITADSPELLLFKIISAINQKGDNITGKIGQNIKDSASTARGLYDELSELLKLLKKETDTARSEALDKQNGNFQDVIKTMTGAFNGALETQNKTLSSKLDDLGGILKEEIKDIQKENRGLITQLVDAEKQLLEISGKNLAKESEERNNKLQEFVKKENDDIKQFIEKQEASYRTIKEGLEQTASDIRKLFNEDIKQLSEESIAQCNNDLVEKSKEYLENHMQSINGYINDLKTQIDGTRKAFEESIGALPDAMSQKLDELHEKETNLINTTIEGNQGNVAILLDENKKAIEAIANGIKEDYENIKSELQTSQDRWKGQAEEIEKANLAKIENIQGETEKKVQAINAAITTLGEGLQTSFDSVKDEIKSSIENNKTNLETLLSANEQSIKRVSDEIKSDNGSIVEELAKAQKGWKEAAEDMERKHQGEVIKIKEKAQQDILKISDAIIRIESTLQQSLNNIAENITKSISEFNSKQDSIKTDAVKQNEELLQDVREQISKSFQINTLQTATGELVNSINGTLNRFNSETNRITGSLSDVEKSIKESSDKYAEAIRNYDEKVKYIGSVIDLFKAHITDMALLQIELEKLNANQVVKELKDDAAQKNEEKQKSHKH